MKKSILIFSMALAALCIQSCSDDEQLGRKPVVADTEIQFGAILDADGKSRTVYGTETDNPNGVGKVWPIYWSYSETDPADRDSIYIYSPQASSTRNQAIYKVEPGEANVPTAVDIQKVGAFGVQTGTENTPYDFYAMYPASAIKAKATTTNDETVFSASLPIEQNATYGSVDIANPEALYEMTPDMNCCLMTAKLNGVDLANTPKVNMTFDPFATAVDIIIPGLPSRNTTPKVLVTSVQIVADQPIAGDFTYNFTTEQFTFGQNQSNTVVVYTTGTATDANGTARRVGIPMIDGNKMRLQAFLLPNKEVKTLQVKVYTSDAQVWTKTLEMNDQAHQFAPRKVNKVTLPKLAVAEAEFDYSSWISQLDPNIYISEISLPGSTSSFSYTLDDYLSDADGNPTQNVNHSKLQKLTLSQQFDAGIRVFRCHIWLYEGGSSIPGVGGNNHFGINVNGGREVISLWEAVQTLRKEMADNRNNGFCVLMVSDYKVTDSSIQSQSLSWNTDNGKTFYERFKVMADALVAQGCLPETEVGPNTTIADVKGKIILKLQMNANGGEGVNNTSTTGVASGWSSLNIFNRVMRANQLVDKINGWKSVDGAPVLFNWWTATSGSQLFYSPMTFERIGDYTISNFSASSSGRATCSVTTAGLGSMVGELITARGSANGWDANSWTTNANCNEANVNAEPAFYDFTKNMWYIYGAQSNPTTEDQLTDADNMVSAAVDAIQRLYLPNGQTKHNKFYMTYLGGASASYTTTDVTQKLVPTWNTAVSSNLDSNKPLGWVMFNSVPEANLDITNLAETNPDRLVKVAIDAVISRNNDIRFPLTRKPTSSTPAKAAPTGDVQGTPAKGSIF